MDPCHGCDPKRDDLIGRVYAASAPAYTGRDDRECCASENTLVSDLGQAHGSFPELSQSFIDGTGMAPVAQMVSMKDCPIPGPGRARQQLFGDVAERATRNSPGGVS